jgi:hypothetical protein
MILHKKALSIEGIRIHSRDKPDFTHLKGLAHPHLEEDIE